MSDNLGAEKPAGQPDDDLSTTMKNLSVTTADDFDKNSPPKNLFEMPIDLTSLHLCVQPDWISFKYNKKEVYYGLPGCQKIEQLLGEDKKDEKITLIVGDDFEKIAFDDLTNTLKNPNLQLESFSVSFYKRGSHGCANWDKYVEFRNILESINHQISTRKCEIDIECPSKYCSILPFLKPGTLKAIEVWYHTEGAVRSTLLEIMEQVSNLDQWKQAKQLTLKRGSKRFPWEYATHFNRININFKFIDGDSLNYIINRLSQLPNLEYSSISSQRGWKTQKLHANVGQPAPPNDRTQYVSHFSTPNSDDFLEIMYFKESIEVTKKKRSNSGL